MQAWGGWWSRPAFQRTCKLRSERAGSQRGGELVERPEAGTGLDFEGTQRRPVWLGCKMGSEKEAGLTCKALNWELIVSVMGNCTYFTPHF